MSNKSDKSEKIKEKDKQTEKTQTTEKTQINQNQTPFSFLKGVDSKKKEAQTQLVEIQPVGSEAIQANQTKTPGTIPKEIIAINDLENENEKKKMETEGNPEIEENETQKKERELKEKLFREVCERNVKFLTNTDKDQKAAKKILKLWSKKPVIEQNTLLKDEQHQRLISKAYAEAFDTKTSAP
jgi:hypothetical protein